MAFRKKADIILAYQPDILIVPECEHPDKLKFTIDTPKPSGIVWLGANQNKGLAVLSYNNFKLKKLDNHNPEIKLIVPVAINKGRRNFILLAIWANNPNDADGQYVEQVWKAIQYYSDLLDSKKIVLAGDFNSNTIWDRKYRISNHSNVVKFLEQKNIFSSYHVHHKQVQGKEDHPTYYLYRHKDKPYHLDYCFVSKSLAKKISSVEIGEYDTWRQYSDHVPVMVKFDLY